MHKSTMFFVPCTFTSYTFLLGFGFTVTMLAQCIRMMSVSFGMVKNRSSDGRSHTSPVTISASRGTYFTAGSPLSTSARTFLCCAISWRITLLPKSPAAPVSKYISLFIYVVLQKSSETQAEVCLQLMHDKHGPFSMTS